MKKMLLSLIGVSFLQSILLLMVNEKKSTNLLKVIGGVIMASVLIEGFAQFDFSSYAASLQRERTEMSWDADSVKNEVNALNRRYIESQCAAYILENASKLGIDLSNVIVTVAWNTDGYWYPVHAEMTVRESADDVDSLKRLIENELGVPIEEQVWKYDEQR